MRNRYNLFEQSMRGLKLFTVVRLIIGVAQTLLKVFHSGDSRSDTLRKPIKKSQVRQTTAIQFHITLNSEYQIVQYSKP